MYGSSPIGSASVGSLSSTVKIALLVVAETESEGIDLQGRTYLELETAEIESEGIDSQMRTYLLITPADTESEGNDGELLVSGTAPINAGLASLEVEGIDSDVNYIVDDVPILLIERTSGTETSVDVENQEGRKIRIYRALSEQALYSPVTITDALPFNDSGLLATNNYKYKATFAVEGNKGGSSVIEEGRKSDPRFTRKTE